MASSVADSLAIYIGSATRMLWWKGTREVPESCTLAAKQSAFDLVHEHTAAPAILNGLAGVPYTFNWLAYGIEQSDVVASRQ